MVTRSRRLEDDIFRFSHKAGTVNWKSDDHKVPKSISSETLPHKIPLSGDKCSKAWAYGRHFSFKPLHLGYKKPWGLISPVLPKPGMVAHTPNPSTQGHPQLHSMFRASLGYVHQMLSQTN